VPPELKPTVSGGRARLDRFSGLFKC
jgi:hypothetical protein